MKLRKSGDGSVARNGETEDAEAAAYVAPLRSQSKKHNKTVLIVGFSPLEPLAQLRRERSHRVFQFR